MRKSQELTIRLSEARERLNAAIEKRNGIKDGEQPSGELISEMDAATKAVGPLEVEYRAALTAEGDEDDKSRRDDPDAEVREFDKLLQGASILPFLNEALEGKETGGKEHEIRAKLLGDEARAGVVPFEMLLPLGDTEQRADAATTVAAAVKTQGTQAPVLERVFSRSIAARLLVSMPSVPVGSANYPIMTAGTDAAMKNPGVAQDAAAATFEGFTLDPKRLTARYLFRIEDQYKLRGYESVLRRDLSAVMSDAMDAQIVNGDGQGADVTGFLSELTAPGADNAVTSWGGYFGKFSSFVDGLNAYQLSDVRVIEGKDTFGYAETLFRTGANDNGPRASAREYVGSRIGGMSVSSRIPATATSGTLNKHQVNIAALTSYPGRNAVAPVWRAFSVIRDVYTGAASGEVAITAVALWNFKILRETGFSLYAVRNAA